MPESSEGVAEVADFEKLTPSEKRTLQAAVHVAVSEIGTLVVALQRRDPAGPGLRCSHCWQRCS